MTIQIVPLDQLVEHPTNPWNGRADVAELAENVKIWGVMSPLLVRPKDGLLEICFGHRRFRAAQLAGLEEVPCMVREMTDEQIISIRLSENVQRKEIHEIDAGEDCTRLNREHGWTAEQIAEHLGKSRSWVYEHMRLSNLAPELKQACYAGTLQTSVALILAARPQTQQIKLLEKTTTTGAGGGRLSVREARDMIVKQTTHDLSQVPWDLADPNVPPGACVGCISFASVEGGRQGTELRCIDGECFRRKHDAFGEVEIRRLAGLGARALTAEFVAANFAGEFYTGKGEGGDQYVDLGSYPWNDEILAPEADDAREYIDLLSPEIVSVCWIHRFPSGRIVKLGERKDVARIGKLKGIPLCADQVAAAEAEEQAETQAGAGVKLPPLRTEMPKSDIELVQTSGHPWDDEDEDVLDRATVLLVEQVQGLPLDRCYWKPLCEAMVHAHAGYNLLSHTAAITRGFVGAIHDPQAVEDFLIEAIDGMKECEMQALAFELTFSLLRGDAQNPDWFGATLLERFGVERDQCETHVGDADDLDDMEETDEMDPEAQG